MGDLGRVATEHTTLTGQRRQVTILFCDLVGSTALSYQLDPEDLGELVLGYQEMGQAAVARYGGHVAQYLGDGLAAIFGYPEAHEDDAERAVRAAHEVLAGLEELNDRDDSGLGVRLEARVGIATGLAVVGAMGNETRVDLSMFGTTPNLAARLEGVATPGTVVLSDRTKSLVAHCCVLEDLGVPELKGVEPTRVWLVTDLLAPGAARGVRASPLVGRGTELARLLDAWDLATEGRGGAITVVGEAGIGKTRLLDELAARAEQAGGVGAIVTLACSPLQTATPLAPVIRALQAASARDGWPTLGAWAQELAVPDAELLDLLDTTTPLATGGDRDLLWRRTVVAAAELVATMAGPGPALIRVEDVHWADPSTLELLRHLAEIAADRPLLVVASQRPDGSPTFGTGSLVLERLGDAEVVTIADRLLPVDFPARAEAIRLVCERAEGVALFAEELAATLAEDPTARSVPASLHDTLLSRLDRLGPAAATAQLASVVGRDVDVSLLEALAGATVDADVEQLVGAGLMVRVGDVGDAVVSFRHALIRDAAYDSLLRRDRRRLHGTIAEQLVGRDPTFGAHQPQVLAHHLAGAGRHLEAATVLRDAGRRAGGDGAFAESIDLLGRGRAVVEAAPPSDGRDALELELVVLHANSVMAAEGYGAERTRAMWERGIELAEAGGNHAELTAVLNGLASYHADHGDNAAALALGRRILALAEENGLRIGGLRAHTTLALGNLYLGNVQATIEHGLAALELYEDDDFEEVTFGLGTDHKVIILGALSFALWGTGRIDEAVERAEEGVAHARRIDSRLSASMAMMFLAVVRHLRGEHTEAIAVSDELRTEAELLRFPFWLAFADLVAGAALAEVGEAERGVTLVLGALDALASSGSSSGAALGLALLARAQARAGDTAGAHATAELGLALAADQERPFFDLELLHIQARAGLDAGILALPAARELLVRAVEDAAAGGLPTLELRAALAWAAVEGDDERAVALARITHVLSVLTEGSTTADQRDARALLSQSHTELRGAP